MELLYTRIAKLPQCHALGVMTCSPSVLSVFKDFTQTIAQISSPSLLGQCQIGKRELNLGKIV